VGKGLGLLAKGENKDGIEGIAAGALPVEGEPAGRDIVNF
jgi:hypothetical protein